MSQIMIENFSFSLLFIKAELIYKIVLVSGIQQSVLFFYIWQLFS